MSNCLKHKLLLVALIFSILTPNVCMAAYVIPGTGVAAASKEVKRSALMLYSSLDSPEDEREEIVSLYSALRTYCTDVSILEISEYHLGLLKDMQYVFIKGENLVEVNEDLGRDLQSFGGVIGWIGGGIEQYADYGLIRGFDITGYANEFTELCCIFKNKYGTVERRVAGKRKNIPKIRITDGTIVQSYGSITIGNDSFPYALQSNKVWCFSMFERNEEGGAVFRYILDRMFEQEQREKARVYVKIDNVSPFVDFHKLKDAGNWLEEQGVPFVMELRPVFVNTDYEHMKRFAALVREMQMMGGTAVLGTLQGWKPPDEWQQYIQGDSPLSGSESMTPEKLIYTSFKAYLEYDVYPIAFAGPIDAFFDPELGVVLKHFSTFIQSSSWKGYSTSIQPGAAWNGNFVPSLMLKENNNKVIERNLNDVYTDIEMAGNVAFALGFDGLTGLEDLKESVLRLKGMGVKLEDIRELNSTVEFEGIKLAIKDRKFLVNDEKIINVKKNDQELEVVSSDNLPIGLPVNMKIKQIITFVIIIVSMFILMFTLAFIAGKKIDRKKHLR